MTMRVARLRAIKDGGICPSCGMDRAEALDGALAHDPLCLHLMLNCQDCLAWARDVVQAAKAQGGAA